MDDISILMSRMQTRSMTRDTSSSFLELPDNEGESESEYETDTCSGSDTDPSYTEDMIMVTEAEAD